MTKRILLTTLAAGLVAALAVSVAFAHNGRPSPSPRAQGAPGAPWAACKQNHTPGTQAFRDCVRNAARARAQGRNGIPARIGRACASHQRGTPAFRNCVRQQIQQRRAAVRQCRQTHRNDRVALRNCVRAALR